MSLATSRPNSSIDVNFPALVRLLRQVRGLTQEDFAREIDVTVGTLNGWENGRHRPVRAQRNRLLRMADDAKISVPLNGQINKETPSL